MNAISPVVTMAGLEFGGVIAGSLVIENVFAWPGLGRLVIIAIHGRDYPVIQGYILLTMTGFIICNFIAETVCMRVSRRWGCNGKYTFWFAEKISAFFNMFFMGNRILLFSCGDI